MRTTQGRSGLMSFIAVSTTTSMDPQAFRPESALGVPASFQRPIRRQRDTGQCHRHRRRRRQVDLSLCAGDDRFYLGEEPILNNVRPTCAQDGRTLVCPRSPGGTGGQGKSTVRRRLRDAGRPGLNDKRNRSSISVKLLIAGPTVYRPADAGALNCPTFVEEGIAPPPSIFAPSFCRRAIA